MPNGVSTPGEPGHPEDASTASDVVDELRVELLRRGRTCTGRLTSGSMSPTIEAGDEVVVAPVRALRPGLVVLFRSEGRLTVHRLLGRGARRGRWLEKGDRNPLASEIDEADLLGEVVEVRKPDGTLSLDGARARAAGRAIAALGRLAAGLEGSRIPGSRIALRIVRRAADALLRGAARPRGSG